MPEITRLIFCVSHLADARLLVIQAGEQSGPCRTTAGSIVKLRVPDAVSREIIDVRRMRLASVTAEVRIAHIVGHDEDNIRAFLRCGPGLMFGLPGK